MEDTLRLNIDATPAEAGARRFNQAILSIRSGVTTASRAATGAFTSMTQAVSRSAGGFGSFSSAVNGLNFNSTHRSVVGLTTGMRGLENAFSASFQAASLFRVALGSLTLGAFVKQIFDASVTLDRFVTTMQAATGSMAMAGDALRFTQDLALSLGQDLRVVQEEFSQFAVATSVAGMAMSTTEKIFSSVSKAMTVMGRSSYDARLSFLALQQMVSKGTVQTEELRRQLGERMPGAVQMMAQAVGVTTAELGKMMKAGTVITKDVLPKFAAIVEQRFGKFVPDAFERADVQLGRLVTTFTILKQQIGNAGFMSILADALESMVDKLSSPEFAEVAMRLGHGLADAMTLAGKAAMFVIENLETLIKVGKLLIGIGLASQVLGWVNALTSVAGPLALIISQFGALRTAMTASAVAAQVGVLPALSAIGPTSAVAARGVTALGMAFRIALGPVGLILSAVGLGLYLFAERNETAADKVAQHARAVQGLTGDLDEVERHIAKMSEADLQNTAKHAEEGMRAAAEMVKQVRIDTLGEMRSMLQNEDMGSRLFAGFGEAAIPEATLNSFKQLFQQFRGGRVSAEEFITQLDAIDKPTEKAVELGSALRTLVMRIIEADSAYDKFIETENNLSSAGVDEMSQAHRRATEDVKSTAVALSDAALSAGASMEEMNQEITRSKLTGYALELAEVKDETSDVENALRKAIEAMEAAPHRFVTAEQTQELEDAKAALVEYLALQEKLAKARFDQSKDAKKVAKDHEKEMTAAQKLVDELYPVVAANREYEEGLGTLRFAVDNHILSEEKHAEAVELLGKSLEDVVNPLGAYHRELNDSLKRAERAVEFEKRMPSLIRDHSLAISDHVPLTEELTDAQLEQLAATIAADEALRNPPDPTGMRAFVEETRNVTKALAEVEEDAIAGVSDALTEFVTTGKLEISSLVDSIIKDLAQIGINTALRGLFDQLAGVAGGAGATGSQGGSFLADGMGLVSGMFSGGGGGGSGILSGLTSLFDFGGGGTAPATSFVSNDLLADTFRTGGISHRGMQSTRVSASDFIDAPHFRDGGLTSGAIPAILHPNEAVVPLAGGKIPVDMGHGERVQAAAPNVTVHMTVNAQDAGSFNKSKDQIAQDLGRKINQATRKNG